MGSETDTETQRLPRRVCNYFLDRGLNAAVLLFPGVACFALAVVFGSLTHVFNEEHLSKRKHAFDE